MLECAQNCSLHSQCLYHLATTALAEIEEARAKGLGNGTTISTSFKALDMINGEFIVEINPENPKKQMSYTYYQFSFDINRGHIGFDDRLGGGVTGRSFSLSPRKGDPSRLKTPPYMDVIGFLKKQAGL